MKRVVPAQFTSASVRPKRSRMVEAAARQLSSLVTLSSTTSARAPSAVHSAATASAAGRVSSSSEQTPMSQPWLAKVRAQAAPIPVAAPVMRQTGLAVEVMEESLPRGRGIVHRPGRPNFPEPCMRGVSRWTDPTGVGGSA